MRNLWPESIAKVGTKAPVTILREQASLLGEKTANLVKAEVAQEEWSPLMSVFRYDFYIVAPALGYYRYKLFTIENEVSLYPVTFYPDRDILEGEFSSNGAERGLPVAESEEEFMDILGRIFGARKTGYLINALLAQMEGAEEREEIPF